jgi:hypothetical protein
VETRDVLEQVKTGIISIEEAEKYFKKQPFEELGYAPTDRFVQAFRRWYSAAESRINIL